MRFVRNAAGYDVIDPVAGPTGTLRRITRTAESGVERSEWQPVTPDGEPGPVFDQRGYAALWLRYEVAPHLLEKPAAPPDPVLAAVRRYLADNEPHQAAAAVLVAIAEDIDQMRHARAHHNPPAIWNHLDRFTRWLNELTSEDRPAAALPARLAHLQAVI